MIQTRSEVVDHIFTAIDNENTVMDVKELVDKPRHGMRLMGLGPITVLEFFLEEEYELVLHPQLGIIEE